MANDASSWWWNDCMMTWCDYMIFFLSYSSFDLLKWYSREPDRLIDGLTDRWKDRPSYKDAHDASSEPSILPLSTICSKILISCFWRKRDRPTDGRTDRPGYRDARTHLIMYTYSLGKKSKTIFDFWLMLEKRGFQFSLGEVCESWAILWPAWMACWH